MASNSQQQQDQQQVASSNKTKIVFNITDDRFVLIMWKNEKYNVLPMKDIQKLDVYEIDVVVKCKFGAGKHPGTIKYIGNEDECNAKLNSILDYLQDESLKQKVTKKPTGQKLAESINNNHEICKQQQVEAENKDLHQKLNYKEEQINELTETVVQLTAKLQEETQKNEKQHSTINQFKESSDCQKLLAIGLSLVNILAKPTDLAELNVVTENINENESEQVLISSRFPNFFISQQLKSTLVSMSKDKNIVTGKSASTSSIYRSLIKNLFTNNQLANSNSHHLKQNQPILSACKDLMLTIRNDFNSIIESKVLREECSHARQSIWKQDSAATFSVNGNELKKTEKTKEANKSNGPLEVNDYNNSQ